MFLQGWLEAVSARLSPEIVWPDDPEDLGVLIGNAQLVLGDEKRSCPGTIRRLDLQPTLSAGLITGSVEGHDVVAVTVAIVHGDPADAVGQVLPAKFLEAVPFHLEDERFSGGAYPGDTSCGCKLARRFVGRSTKAGAHTPATPPGLSYLPFQKAALNEGRGAYPGDTRQSARRS